MMKRLHTLLLVLALSSPATKALASIDCPTLTISQKVNLFKIWRYGEEEWGKGQGVKLSAVALQESNLGLYTNGKGSYGIFQLKPTTVAYMEGKKSTKGIKKRLESDFQYSAKQAHQYLEYWSEQGYTDMTMYQRYNGGYTGSKQSKRYAKEVKQKTKLLNKCYVYREGTLHERKAS